MSSNSFGELSGGSPFGADPVSSFGANNQGFGQSAETFDPSSLQIGLGGTFTRGANVSPGKYSILDAYGKDLGYGYDPYAKAIADFAYQRGVMRNPAQAGSPESWSHSFLTPLPPIYGENGPPTDEWGNVITAPQPTFGSEAELQAALAGTGYDTIGNFQKYNAPIHNRPITDMQRGEVLGQFLTDPSMSTVPDWTYHRDLGVHNQTPEAITGEKAFYGGSEPVFRAGKLIGHQVDVSPMSGMEAHNDYLGQNAMGGKDANGAVTSGSYLYRTYNPVAEGGAFDMGEGKIFVPIDKEAEYAGWTNNDNSYYNKESSGFGGLLGKLAPMALAFALGPAGLAALPAWGAGAVGGAFGSAINGGNPLKGAVLGGLGGYAGGEMFGGGGGGDVMSSMSDFVGPSMEMMGPSFELANNFVGPSLDIGSNLGSIPAEGFNTGLQNYTNIAGLPDVANATPYMTTDGVAGSLYEDITTPAKIAESLYKEGSKTSLAKNLSKAYKLGSFGKSVYDSLNREPRGALAAVVEATAEDEPVKKTSSAPRKKVNSSFGTPFGRDYA
jgi:hypothetical protein